jgi:hypothetical protein
MNCDSVHAIDACPSVARCSSFSLANGPSVVAPSVLSGLFGSRALSIWPVIDQSMSVSAFHCETFAFSYSLLSCGRAPFS